MRCYSSNEPTRGFSGDKCQSQLFYRKVIKNLKKTEAGMKRRLVEKKVCIFMGLSVRENPDKARSTYLLFFRSFVVRLSVFMTSFFVCFQERLCIALLLARYSPFYLCLFLFSFAFLSPYSAYFGVLSNCLPRFSRLALCRLLVAFFVRSVSFDPAYFRSKASLHELEL